MNKSWDDTEAKVKQILKEKLNLANDPDMEGAHRVGKRPGAAASNHGSPRRPRTIVCRIRDWKQKELILKNARMIKPVGLFVKEDLAPATIEKREELQPKLIAAKLSREDCILCS